MFEKNKKHSEETRLKISNALKGKIPWNKGLTGVQYCSEETKKKLSKANKGKIRTLEQRQNIRLSKLGKNNPNYGKNHSEETKQKMSQAHKDKKISEKQKLQISLKNTGKKRTKDVKLKMSLSHKGKKMSEAAKEKLRAYYKIHSTWNKGKHTGYITHTKENIRKMLSYKEKRSFPERLLFNRVNNIYKNISIVKHNDLVSDKKFEFRAKPDIIIEKFNIIIEYDGLRFHNDINRDLERDKKLVELGYKIIHYRGYNPDAVEIMNDVDYILEHETNGLYKENEKIILNIN